jgi:hypothetical protein
MNLNGCVGDDHIPPRRFLFLRRMMVSHMQPDILNMPQRGIQTSKYTRGISVVVFGSNLFSKQLHALTQKSKPGRIIGQ